HHHRAVRGESGEVLLRRTETSPAAAHGRRHPVRQGLGDADTMGAVHRTHALRLMRGLRPLGLLLVAACASSPQQSSPPPDRVGAPLPPALPDTTGWGVQVLALARAPDGALWAGTGGQGIYVLRPDTGV